MPKSKLRAENGESVRIVIDTNVLVSALLWRGTPHTLLNFVRSGAVELVISQALLAELSEVINRPKFAAVVASTTRTSEQILNEFQNLAEIVFAPALLQPVCRDPDDDAVLACAMAANASLIVTGDDDLLSLKKFQRIPIISVAQAKKQFEELA